ARARAPFSARPSPGFAPGFAPDRPDIPVWASAAAGDEDGTILLTDSPIDYIRRSETMVGVANPFAFYIVGDSMLERFEQGDQAVVNPSLPLRPGDDCIFINQAADGTMFGLVKRLLRAGADHWRVRQLNPRRDFDLSKKKWSRAYRIAETRHRG
ncbi:MAG: S24 family peptidase, partial [Reyranella sp.]|nr:S24 family peptidase [Reyranella sp.]